MFYIITKSIYTITKILFYVNIILLFSYLSLSAEKTGTLEALILSWSEARKSCDFETNASKKDSHCDTQLQYEQALKAKGLCRGAHTLKLENDTERDNPLYKDQYEVFEKIVKICFSQRRKKVKNNLDQLNVNTISLLELSNIDPDIRAENIDIEGFIRISSNYEDLIKENYEDF